MLIQIKFSARDIAAVRELVRRQRRHPFVIQRFERNVRPRAIAVSHRHVWRRIIGCLLTTQQKSGAGSAVQRFAESNSPLFSIRNCASVNNIEKLAAKELTEAGGIRRTSVIAQQISANYQWLSSNEGWRQVDELFAPFSDKPQSQRAERDCAEAIDALLKGFGPKQSRNLLQWLGLTQHEIPIDSRIIKWLRTRGRSDAICLLSTAALGDSDYYCGVLDAIQALCAKAEVLPCIFDASVFASFEKQNN